MAVPVSVRNAGREGHVSGGLPERDDRDQNMSSTRRDRRLSALGDFHRLGLPMRDRVGSVLIDDPSVPVGCAQARRLRSARAFPGRAGCRGCRDLRRQSCGVDLIGGPVPRGGHRRRAIMSSVTEADSMPFEVRLSPKRRSLGRLPRARVGPARGYRWPASVPSGRRRGQSSREEPVHGHGRGVAIVDVLEGRRRRSTQPFRQW